MNWNFRTFLRIFLVVGGTGLLVFGLTAGDTLNTVVGAAALVMGVVGLTSEWRDTSEK